jgi:hypothetical protein
LLHHTFFFFFFFFLVHKRSASSVCLFPCAHFFFTRLLISYPGR